MATPRKKIDPERIAALEKKAAQARALLNRERAKQREERKSQERRDDTRRKVIAGALALDHLERAPGSEFSKTLLGLLDQYTRPEDRRLFDFLSARDTETQQINPQSQAA